jgi:hypothetical protein
MHKQVRDFFKLALLGHIQNVIAAIVQIIAGAADGAKRSVARNDAGKCHRLFGFGSGARCCCGGVAHCVLSIVER